MAQIILVASGKGGSGKSSFVTGVSSALAAMGKKVLAVDCDIGLRSLDILFGVTEKIVFDWGDLILDRCTREQAVIKGRADLLAAPRSFATSWPPKRRKSFLNRFRKITTIFFSILPPALTAAFRLRRQVRTGQSLFQRPTACACVAAPEPLTSCAASELRMCALS